MKSTARKRCAIALLGLAVPLVFSAGAIADAASPVGKWKTIDDETGKVKSIVVISDAGGELQAMVERVFSPPAESENPVCDKCEGERKDKPVIGMVILWGLKKSADREYAGGQVLDPAKGKIYKAKLTISEDGKKLEMRGFIGFSLIGRTQTWVRE
jgi:uncharacterized protein (DUF2147 family)